MIEYHNPTAEVTAEVLTYDLKINLSGNNQATIGLLANGFPDSVNFLNQIALAIETEHPGVSLRYYDKGNASIPANDEILGDISEHCDAVIAAYGH